MNKFIKLSGTIFIIFLVSQIFLVSAVEASGDSWEIKKSMPTGRANCGSVAAPNGLIYVIGGSQPVEVGSSKPVNTNEAYNPKTDTWTTKKDVPTPRDSCGVAVYQNKIYVIGGRVSSEMLLEVTGVNEVYDIETDTWETKTAMPTARTGLCANIVNGKIYMIGGLAPIDWDNPSSVSDVNEVYDIETDTWSSRSRLPIHVSAAYTSAVIDDKIYLITSDTRGKSTLIYDAGRDLWSYGEPIPTQVMGVPAGATTGEMAPKRLYVIGGVKRGESDFTLVQIYDPATNTWATGTPMPTSRVMSSIAVMDDYIYVIGGAIVDSVQATGANERYTPLEYKAATLSRGTVLVIGAVTLLVVVAAIIALRTKKRRTPSLLKFDENTAA